MSIYKFPILKLYRSSVPPMNHTPTNSSKSKFQLIRTHLKTRTSNIINKNKNKSKRQQYPSNTKVPLIPHLLFLPPTAPNQTKWNLSPPTIITASHHLHRPSPPPPPSLHPPFTDMSADPKRLSTPTTTTATPHKPKTLPDLFLTTAFSLLCVFTTSSNNNNKSSSPYLKLNFPFYPRRSLKISTTSNLMSRPTVPKHPFASTPQTLSDWLRPRLPSDSFASWGVKPGTKNVHNLWLELSEGETSLADSTPPVRSVNVVTVRILNRDKVLVESRQELSDGNVRDRCRPLSEKMKPGETPEEAVFRAVKEELGSVVSGDGVRILPGSYRSKVEERDSKSYPGLPARYVLHSLDVTVEGLPEGEFCTEEAEEYDGEASKEAVCVRRHHWKWVSVDSIKS